MNFEIGSAPLLKIQDATVQRDGKRILDGLNLEIAEGQHTAILGPNGSGKSTLIKLITRQHYPLARSDGQPVITIFGQERWDVFALRSYLGIVSGDLHDDFVNNGGEITGREAVLSGFFASFGLAMHHQITSEMQDRAQKALVFMEATPLADKPLAQMSTGEARRILIARALVSEPRAVLLDEPTTGLDLVARRQFLDSIRQIAQSGKTVLLVTHHIEEILPEMDRVVTLKNGMLFQDGSKQEILTSENLSALFDAPVDVQERGGYFTAEAVFP